MRAVRLDYVQRPARRWPGYALLALAALSAVGVSASYVHTARTLADAEVAVSRLERRLQRGRDMPGVATAVPTDNALVQRAGDITRKLNTPWERLFRALEALPHEQVALLSVEPDASSGSVRIQAEAKDTATMLAYVEDLREGGWLSAVALNNHQVRQDDPFKPVRFSFSGQWVPAR